MFKENQNDYYLIKEYIVDKKLIITWLDGIPKLVLNRPDIIFDPRATLKNSCIDTIIKNNISYIDFETIPFDLIDDIYQIHSELDLWASHRMAEQIYHNDKQRMCIINEINEMKKIDKSSCIIPYDYKNHYPSKSIFQYSFSLDPEEYQQIGTGSSSRIDNATFQLSFPTYEREPQGKIHIYAKTFNIHTIP